MRLEHDAAHRITIRVIRLVASRFGDDELQELYRTTMPVVVEGIQEYAVQRARQAARLSVTSGETTRPSPALPLPSSGPDAD